MANIRKYIEQDWIIYLQCCYCKCFKPLECFGDDKRNKFFYKRSECKDCHREQSRLHYQNNKELIKQKHKEYNKSNPWKAWIREKKRKEKDPESYRQIRNNIMKRQRTKESFRHKDTVRRKTNRFIDRHNIVYDECCICKSNIKIELHHVNYDERYMIVPCCRDCHMKIHKWIIDCPQAINLLSYLKK